MEPEKRQVASMANPGAPPEDRPATDDTPAVGVGGRRRKIGLAGIGLVVVAVAAFFVMAFFNGPAGKVMFSTTPRDQSSRTCVFTSSITTAGVGDDIYVLAAFNETIRLGETFRIEVFKDNASQFKTDLTAGSDFNCYVETDAMGWRDPGVWKVVFTYQGRIEAEGSITVR
jgi:hypothetical protein